MLYRRQKGKPKEKDYFKLVTAIQGNIWKSSEREWSEIDE